LFRRSAAAIFNPPLGTVHAAPFASRSASATVAVLPSRVRAVKVAIFGDSQATALYMNRPASLAASLNLTDAEHQRLRHHARPGDESAPANAST
jgi:hypothetical protein